MGKATGFLEYERKENTMVPAKTRLRSFHEFHAPLSDGERRTQCARCMDCGVPLCQSAMELAGMVTGCPLNNLIPEWNHDIYTGHLPQALSRLLKTNNFPEFTGRVCPALCEKACVLGQYDLPVTSHDNELYIIESAFREGLMKPRIPAIRSGKKVAVVGSGPSGLAAADQLNHRGHSVTVFERDDRIGGLLMYGIPNMKLDKDVLKRRQALMEAEGVVFRTGADVGKTISPEELLGEFDAVVLCCGAKQARSLQVTVSGGGDTGKAGTAPADARNIPGVYFAVDFLKATTRFLLESTERSAEAFRNRLNGSTGTPLSCISAKDKHVVIVGGGDTGNDCIATVLRHGCRSVTALEMMPAPPEERSASNPWPQWPKTLKTDYGHEEAASVSGSDPRVYETTVKSCIVNKKGELKKIITVRGAFIEGRWTETEGSEKTIPCDLLLIAAGFTGCEPYTSDAFGLTRGPRGTVQTDSGYQTAVPGVFSAGDMHRGQSLVVWAIAEGRACAGNVDKYLMGYEGLPR